MVNAPGFFSLVWRIAEPMLSPSTRKKIRLLHNKHVRSPSSCALGGLRVFECAKKHPPVLLLNSEIEYYSSADLVWCRTVCTIASWA